MEKYLELASNPEFQKRVAEAMGGYVNGDNGWQPIAGYGVITRFFDHWRLVSSEDQASYRISASLIRLPFPVDDSSPEAHKRSLVGMLDIPPRMIPIYDPLNDNEIKCWECEWWDEEHYTTPIVVGGKTLTEALIRCLYIQWGIKEEK